MKRPRIFIFAGIILLLLIGLEWVMSNQREPGRESPVFNTRIDNIGTWVMMAEKGYAPFNAEIKPAPAVFTGSHIDARSVATEDSPDVPVTEAVATQSENSVFVNPQDAGSLLQSNNSSDQPISEFYGANDLYSFDMGETWAGKVTGAGGDNRGDPTTAIGLNGRWYINYIDNAGGQGVSFSDDQGATWINRTVASNPGFVADKNHMWIDNSPESPYEGNLYVAWTDFGGSNEGNIILNRSENNGESWSNNRNISGSLPGFHQGVHIQTGPNGEVYAFYSVYQGGAGGMTAIGMSRSLDGGESWTASIIKSELRGIRELETLKTIRCNDFPVAAVDLSNTDNKGNIYVVWANIGTPGINILDELDIYLIKSTDGASTWSDPVRVNQNPPGAGKTHFFPWITCDPLTGSLSVIFYDDRNVDSTQTEVFCANSLDGGETWEDFKVSDVAFSPSPIPGLAGNYMGDYLGISARGGQVYPVWTDNRLGYAMAFCSPYEFNAPAYPKNLTGIVTFETGTAELNWTFDTEAAPGFAYFAIYRDDELLATTADTNFTDNLPEYGYYDYLVTAFYENGVESVGSKVDLQWGDAYIDIVPDSLFEKLTVDSASVQYLSVSNTGQLPLIYNIAPFFPDIQLNSRSYCPASGVNDNEYIGKVQLSSLDNLSGSSAYTDFTSISTEIKAGLNYTMDVTVINYVNLDQVGAWIDWNQNEDFEDDGLIDFEIVQESPDTAVFRASFQVPFEAQPGPTRMRVRLIYTGELKPCGNTIWGEVEDYTVVVDKWFGISTISDTLMPGETSQVTVDFISAGVEPGSYAADAVFFSNDPEADSVAVSLNLEVVTTAVDASIQKNTVVCSGESVQLQATPFGNYTGPEYSWYSKPEGFESDEQNPVITADSSATYFVEMESEGNIYTDSVFLTVLPSPELDLGPDTAFCSGTELILDAGPGPGPYFWSTGDTSQTIKIDSASFGNYGQQPYSVLKYNDFRCYRQDTIVVEFRNCTSIKENDAFRVNVFPNPNHGTFALELDVATEEKVNILVFNSLGAMVYANENILIRGKRQFHIQLGDGLPGVYQLFIKSKNSSVKRKIIVR